MKTDLSERELLQVAKKFSNLILEQHTIPELTHTDFFTKHWEDVFEFAYSALIELAYEVDSTHDVNKKEAKKIEKFLTSIWEFAKARTFFKRDVSIPCESIADIQGTPFFSNWTRENIIKVKTQNLEQLKGMRDKLIASGKKKYSGYTLEKLTESIERTERILKS